VSIMAQEALKQPDLYMDRATACRTLLIDRRELAIYVLEGKLQRHGSSDDMHFLVDEVLGLKARLAGTTNDKAERLHPQLHRLLEVLHDWGGRGTNGELAIALNRSRQAIADLLSRLKAEGYVLKTSEGRARGTWYLADRGWRYTAAHIGGGV
jgi:hypothetical protein